MVVQHLALNCPGWEFNSCMHGRIESLTRRIHRCDRDGSLSRQTSSQSSAAARATREFGIRMVLGANQVSIFRSILMRGGSQIAVGLACGVALAGPAALLFHRLSKNSPFPFRSFDMTVCRHEPSRPGGLVHVDFWGKISRTFVSGRTTSMLRGF